MGKKFMGLGGTDHFWDRAKSWILNQITSAVTAKIAEVVANAPEDLDTLKEIADWISAHANDAAAMNTQITENKNNIAANSSSISAMNMAILANTEAINGKADIVDTARTIQLSGTVDCNTLTEPGLYTASSDAVISITNTPANIGSAVQLAGGFSILVTKTNVDGVYYGMQMFIPYGSDAPFIRKSYYLNGQYWTEWQELATMDKVAQCVENKSLDAKTVSFELNSAAWNCGTIYGNTNNGGNFKYDYYVTWSNTVELVKQDGYGQQGSITASLSGTTLTLTASENTTIKTVTIIKT